MLWNLFRDARFGLRLLARKPGLTLVAVAVLAIGIGANTTVFGIIDSVLVEPLDYPESDRLVQVWERNQHTGEQSWVYYGNYLDWQARSRAFESMAIYNLWEANVWGDPEPERVKTAWVTTSYFPMLGAEPALGRVFTAAEEAPDAPRVVVISHSLWQRRFGGDMDVLGAPLQTSEGTVEVVGVLPEGFRHPGPPGLEQPELFIPNVAWAGRDAERSGYTWERVIGRLAPGFDLARAQREMDGIAARLATEHPKTNAQRGIALEPLSHHVLGDLRTELRLLMVAVGLVLILVCANVSSLVTVRSMGRRREMAVRSALGAPRTQLIRQLVVESALLAMAGTGLGLLLAHWASQVLRGQEQWGLPRLDEVAIDTSAIAYAVAAAGLGIVLFGLVPALSALRRGPLHPHLKDGGRGVAPGQQVLQRALVVGEVALALTLVVGAGLIVRSYQAIIDTDPGFQPENTVTVELAQSGPRYEESAARQHFWDTLLSRLEAESGVHAAGAVTLPPLQTHDDAPTVYEVEGREPPPAGQEPTAQLVIVTPGYVQAMGLTVLEGRELSPRDRADTEGVVVVNRSLANKLWPDDSAVGRRLRLPVDRGSWWRESTDKDWLTVVGVVADVRLFGLDAEPVPEIYRAFAQEPWTGMTLVVRGDASPESLRELIRGHARAIDPNQPLVRFTTMDAVYDRSLARRRLLSSVLAGFAGIALLLASIGIYGLMAWSVTQRTREIGIRVAIGARAADILRMVLAQSGRLAAFGVAIGLPLAWLLTRVMSSLLFGVSGLDLPTWVGAILALASIAFLAGLLPAWRAAKVDPLVALRHD